MRRTVAFTAAVLVLAIWATPASAARRPRPTATLVDTGTITTEQGDETYLEVLARDPDGIITEIEVRWGDGSFTFAHSYPCFLPSVPEPGTTHRYLVSNPYQEPGTYRVQYVVHSISGCDAPITEQHSRPYTIRLTAP